MSSASYYDSDTPSKAGAPSASDDASKGHYVGESLVDSNTGYVYVCTSAAVGAAVWGRAGGDSFVGGVLSGSPDDLVIFPDDLLVLNGSVA